MRRASNLAVMVTTALIVGGCYVHPVDYYPPPGPVIGELPPPPLAEEVPAEWPDGNVWVAGYWHWTGASYAWIAGRFVVPPADGLYWYPGGYVRIGGGYMWVRGGWVGLGFRPYYRYVYGWPRWHRRYYAYAPSRRWVRWYRRHGGRRYLPAPEFTRRDGRRYAPAPELGETYRSRRRRGGRFVPGPPGRGLQAAPAPSRPRSSRRRAPPSE